MNLINAASYLIEGKELSKKHWDMKVDSKKVVEALKSPEKQIKLNPRESDIYENFRDVFSNIVITGVSNKYEITEIDAEILKELGFKVSKPHIDEFGYTVYHTNYKH